MNCSGSGDGQVEVQKNGCVSATDTPVPDTRSEESEWAEIKRAAKSGGRPAFLIRARRPPYETGSASPVRSKAQAAASKGPPTPPFLKVSSKLCSDVVGEGHAGLLRGEMREFGRNSGVDCGGRGWMTTG